MTEPGPYLTVVPSNRDRNSFRLKHILCHRIVVTMVTTCSSHGLCSVQLVNACQKSLYWLYKWAALTHSIRTHYVWSHYKFFTQFHNSQGPSRRELLNLAVTVVNQTVYSIIHPLWSICRGGKEQRPLCTHNSL